MDKKLKWLMDEVVKRNRGYQEDNKYVIPDLNGSHSTYFLTDTGSQATGACAAVLDNMENAQRTSYIFVRSYGTWGSACHRADPDDPYRQDFLEFLTRRSVLSDVFVPDIPMDFLNNYGVIFDASKPALKIAMATMKLRYLWENYPKLKGMAKLIELGVDENVALWLSEQLYWVGNYQFTPGSNFHGSIITKAFSEVRENFFRNVVNMNLRSEVYCHVAANQLENKNPSFRGAGVGVAFPDDYTFPVLLQTLLNRLKEKKELKPEGWNMFAAASEKEKEEQRKKTSTLTSKTLFDFGDEKSRLKLVEFVNPFYNPSNSKEKKAA